MAAPMELVFVVDGTPDRSLEILRERLPLAPFPARLLSLSRNFGSFSAIAAGLEAGAGEYFAVLAADLQEPPELIAEFRPPPVLQPRRKSYASGSSELPHNN
jgi:glycosyltransferase involved in cell wall biosynthesis